jgi:hypothetical protein
MPCATGACSGGQCTALPSCAALHALDPMLASGIYLIDPDGDGPVVAFETFCEMTEDGGGWTLAMKIDGNQLTFHYDSPYWTNDETLNPISADLDPPEAKLASFFTMPLTSVRVGMRQGAATRWLILPATAPSLKSIFLGPFVQTALGRQAWLSLLSSSMLQDFCDREGFNAGGDMAGDYARARIGILGNNEPECVTPDSRLGFGMAGSLCMADPANTCGNEVRCHLTGGDLTVKVFGYVMIR